jgi:hypothetical protein
MRNWANSILFNSLFFLGALIPSFVYSQNSPGISQDISDTFSHYYESEFKEGDSLLTNEDLSSLKQIKILLIPGYFSDMTLKWTPVKYFDSAIAMLEKRGLTNQIDFERHVLRSQSSTEENIPLIKKWIEESPRKVLIFGHSKGGRDTLLTLLRFPSLQSRVAGFVSIQSPFAGTPLADKLLGGWFFKSAFSYLLGATGGTLESLQEFSEDTSTKMLNEHYHSITKLSFPILNFASFLTENQDMSIFVLRPFYNMIRTNEFLSDGLVPTSSAILPGNGQSCFILQPGFDHTDLVVSFGNRGHRKKFFESLLKTYLEKLPLIQ